MGKAGALSSQQQLFLVVSPDTVLVLGPISLHHRAPRLVLNAAPLWPRVSSSPIRQQVELAGHGDALLGVYSLFHDEHFRLLMVHLDGLGAQGLLAAAEMEGRR